MTSLDFRGFGFTYASATTPSLAGVTLSVPAGGITSVLAGQGEGKTTVLRAAAGLLGEVYNGDVQGTVGLSRDGVALAGRNAGAFFDGYVQVTLAVETVADELALPLYAAGVPRDARQALVRDTAAELRMDHLLGRSVTALSGGEEKLVGIAAALVPDVPLYVLDEPFEQLDVSHIAAVIAALRRRARAGRIVLVATSSLDIAVNIADNAIVRRSGSWEFLAAPTYADAAAAAGEDSAVHAFLGRHGTDATGIHRFRDAVMKAS